MKKILSLIVMGCALSASAQTYTLEQIKDSALRNNIAIRSAKYNIATAQQQRKEAFTKYFPNVSGTGLWFNANKGMAQTTLNLSESLSPELGAALAQSLPPEALAALGNPISISMMKNGTIGSLMAVQPVFAGGQIINGNKLAKVGEDVSRLQLQLSENEVEKTAEQYFWQLASMQEKMKTVEAVDTLLAGIHNDVDVAVRACRFGDAQRLVAGAAAPERHPESATETTERHLHCPSVVVAVLWSARYIIRHNLSVRRYFATGCQAGSSSGTIGNCRISAAWQTGGSHQSPEEDGRWPESAISSCWRGLQLP